ncbi:EscR/YscR/HrcR family type III secretion system export apparatus protein [Oxalobacteraceae bacterium CAVE-383]|nr:EscR/YscR/HrcR family type III secretion system export apparatus protein [Oxalobacteraceae bacterium CAVE-383]
MSDMNPVVLSTVVSCLALVPLTIVMTTSFLKISIVAMLLRNALGVQQIPPNIAVYGLALILSAYVMAPVGEAIFDAVAAQPDAMNSISLFYRTVLKAAEPLRDFMLRNTESTQLDFFIDTARQLWPPSLAGQVGRRDFTVLVPAFMISELTSAFMIGFLIYLPFVVIDLVVQSILLALGMMMMSPMTVSLPLKLLLFVMADGWTRLLHSLVLSYAS